MYTTTIYLAYLKDTLLRINANVTSLAFFPPSDKMLHIKRIEIQNTIQVFTQ